MPEHTEEERKKNQLAKLEAQAGVSRGGKALSVTRLPGRTLQEQADVPIINPLGKGRRKKSVGIGQKVSGADLGAQSIIALTPVDALTSGPGITRVGVDQAGIKQEVPPRPSATGPVDLTPRLKELEAGIAGTPLRTLSGGNVQSTRLAGAGIRKEEITDPAQGEFAGVGAGVRRVGIDIGRAPKPVKVEGKTARKIKAALIKTQNEQEKLKIQRLNVESQIKGREFTRTATIAGVRPELFDIGIDGDPKKLEVALEDWRVRLGISKRPSTESFRNFL